MEDSDFAQTPQKTSSWQKLLGTIIVLSCALGFLVGGVIELRSFSSVPTHHFPHWAVDAITVTYFVIVSPCFVFGIQLTLAFFYNQLLKYAIELKPMNIWRHQASYEKQHGHNMPFWLNTYLWLPTVSFFLFMVGLPAEMICMLVILPNESRFSSIREILLGGAIVFFFNPLFFAFRLFRRKVATGQFRASEEEIADAEAKARQPASFKRRSLLAVAYILIAVLETFAQIYSSHSSKMRWLLIVFFWLVAVFFIIDLIRLFARPRKENTQSIPETEHH